MFYKDSSAVVVKEGKWDEKSCIRRIGGYDVDKSNLPAGMKWLPKGAVLELTSAGKAKMVKSAVVYEAAAKDATSVKVQKGHALIVGDVLAGKAISDIDTSNASFDTLTIAALGAAVKVGDVIVSTGTSSVILGLNYATVALDDMPSCTPTLQAYEIEEDTLPYPINASIKEALTVRHAFKL